jgi:hypothetical protein
LPFRRTRLRTVKQFSEGQDYEKKRQPPQITCTNIIEATFAIPKLGVGSPETGWMNGIDTKVQLREELLVNRSTVVF